VEFDTVLTSVDDYFGTILGGTGAVVLFDRLVLGASGYGVAYHDRDYPGPLDRRVLQIGYGGATLGVIAAKRSVFSSSFNAFFGGGEACLRNTSGARKCDTNTAIFVSHLELAGYLRLSKFARIGVAFGYRFVAGAEDWQGPHNWDLASGYGAIRLALGRF
jgi:hypothetical protein